MPPKSHSKRNKTHTFNPNNQSDPSSHNNPNLRKVRAKIAQETLKISQECQYTHPDVKDPIKFHAFDKDVFEYAPEDENLQKKAHELVQGSVSMRLPRISVHNMGTITTCAMLHKRLCEERQGQTDLPDPSTQICALNFASAKNPGGGFLKGSMAQEESLSLCSNLYESIHRCRMYKYHSGKTERRRDGLYNHFVIFSQRCSVFRDDTTLKLSVQPFEMQFVTAPAVNAGVFLKRHSDKRHEVESTMEERMRRVLRCCAMHGQKYLVLGAYGCGVFKNDPRFVARTWMKLLHEDEFAGCFTEVAFGVLGDENYRIFAEICGRGAKEE